MFMLGWKTFTETTEPWNCVLSINQSIRYFATWLKGQTLKPNACVQVLLLPLAICEALNTSLNFSMPHTFTFLVKKNKEEKKGERGREGKGAGGEEGGRE